MARLFVVLSTFLLHWAIAGVTSGQELPSSPSAADIRPAELLRVGIKQAVPFSIRDEDGTWSGISVELWREVAKDLGYRYEFVELPLEELLTSVEVGDVDVALGAITATADREQRMDFTHPYFNSGLGIAVSLEQHVGWSAVVGRLASTTFLKIVAGIIGLLVVTGHLIYLLERHTNQEHFDESPMKGTWNGIWWAAVTMTTVGYGDRVPKTVGGRLIAMIWMFSAIGIIAITTATVTSTLTLAKLESKVRGPSDLRDVRVSTVADATSADYMTRKGLPFIKRDTLEACLKVLKLGAIDAVVYDAPILRYQCLHNFPSELEVLPTIFEKQDYAFALPEKSHLREPINRAILERTGTSVWMETIQRYLGHNSF